MQALYSIKKITRPIHKMNADNPTHFQSVALKLCLLFLENLKNYIVYF